jgi:hypothetical protein
MERRPVFTLDVFVAGLIVVLAALWVWRSFKAMPWRWKRPEWRKKPDLVERNQEEEP